MVAREAKHLTEGPDSDLNEEGYRARNPATIVKTWASIPDDTNEVGLIVPAFGEIFQLGGKSDLGAELLVGLDSDRSDCRVGRGGEIQTKKPFRRLMLRRPSILPADTSRFFYLNISWTDARLRELLDKVVVYQGSGINPNSGVATVTNADSVILATNPNRDVISVFNPDMANTLWLAFGRAPVVGSDWPVPPSSFSKPLRATGTLHGIYGTAGARSVSFIEETRQ